ncbi:hypothetical protein [Synechococcus phage Ssp-JY38]|nr:putative head-tail adaptor [Synechococcus phage Yong-L2-223]
MMARKRVKISALRHYIALCSMDDVITENGTMILVRKDVSHAWAAIEAKQPSMFGVSGYNLPQFEPGQGRNKQTHLITMRMRRDFDISSSAWVYEERMQSGQRWFKILGIKEMNEEGNYMVLSARLIERGEDLTPPVPQGEDHEPAQVIKRHDIGVKL